MLEPLEARVAVRTPRLERLAAPAAAAPISADAGPILARLVGSLTGNFTRIVGQLEDPARMLRFSRLELESHLMAVNREVTRIRTDIARIRRAAAEFRTASEGWNDKATIAVAHDRDDLARAAIAEGLAASARAEAADRKVDALSARQADLASEADRLRKAIGESWTRERRLTDPFADATLTLDDPAIDEALDRLKSAQPSRLN